MVIVLIGQPNTGKSAVFNLMTNAESIVSNYAGTSMEISKAKICLKGMEITIYDTPGIYSLYTADPASKQVKELLNNQQIDLIINVIDASRLEQNLPLTLELQELPWPMIVTLNQIDQLADLGLEVDSQALASILNCPVVEFSIYNSSNWEELERVVEFSLSDTRNTDRLISPHIKQSPGCVNNGCLGCNACVETDCEGAMMRRVNKARNISQMTAAVITNKQSDWINKIQTLIDKPFPGIFILILLGYLCFILLLESIQWAEGPLTTLLQPFNNYIASIIRELIPVGSFQNILAQAIPEGLLIPFTIVMPAMLMVAVIMALLEDTGLLPRFSVAFARLGSIIGISGEAIIPLSLGLGCRTPAVVASRMVTREHERFIVITLLSIVIPCAATMGILASVISAFNVSPVVIIVTMLVTLISLGLILNRLLPQEKHFLCELPPLRIPRWNNLLSKIKIRSVGFFTEVLPLLLVMSIAVRALIESGVLENLHSLKVISHSLFGIPGEALVAVLITIFQRYLAPLILLHLPLG
ncbi:MAG: FeoB small GTPase domain-containing protein, partial [Syntrophomonadaceae bacterium]